MFPENNITEGYEDLSARLPQWIPTKYVLGRIHLFHPINRGDDSGAQQPRGSEQRDAQALWDRIYQRTSSGPARTTSDKGEMLKYYK